MLHVLVRHNILLLFVNISVSKSKLHDFEMTFKKRTSFKRKLWDFKLELKKYNTSCVTLNIYLLCKDDSLNDRILKVPLVVI